MISNINKLFFLLLITTFTVSAQTLDLNVVSSNPKLVTFGHHMTAVCGPLYQHTANLCLAQFTEQYCLIDTKTKVDELGNVPQEVINDAIAKDYENCTLDREQIIAGH